MAWNRETKEHLSLWRFVRQEHEEDAKNESGRWISMDDAGEWDNSFIISGSAGDSTSIVERKSNEFASKADAFIIAIGVDRNNSVSEDDAIAKLAQGFAVPDSKLKSMGDIMTTCYIVNLR